MKSVKAQKHRFLHIFEQTLVSFFFFFFSLINPVVLTDKHPPATEIKKSFKTKIPRFPYNFSLAMFLSFFFFSLKKSNTNFRQTHYLARNHAFCLSFFCDLRVLGLLENSSFLLLFPKASDPPGSSTLKITISGPRGQLQPVLLFS